MRHRIGWNRLLWPSGLENAGSLLIVEARMLGYLTRESSLSAAVALWALVSLPVAPLWLIGIGIAHVWDL